LCSKAEAKAKELARTEVTLPRLSGIKARTRNLCPKVETKANKLARTEVTRPRL